MKIGILGKGFGLYGYLPACIQNSWEVHTLGRYKKEIHDRSELSDFWNILQYHSDESALIAGVDALVCARDPQSQIRLLSLVQGFRGHLYLEKPLAPTIELHEETLNILELSALNFSIGYLLPYTGWYQEIVSASEGDQIHGVEIHWSVKPTDTLWKSKPGLGGGVADYYAIHLVSLLSDLHIDLDKLHFYGDKDQLEIFSGTNAKFTINIRISTAIENRFQVLTVNKARLLENRFESISPFGSAPVRGVRDPRIPYLAQYLSEATAKSDSKESVSTERQIIRYRKLALAGRNLRLQSS